MKHDSPGAARILRYEELLVALERGADESEPSARAAVEPADEARMRAHATYLLAGLADARLPELGVERRARAVGTLRHVREAERTSLFKTLFARLVADPGPPALAMRAGGARASFQALYELDGYDLDLFLSEEGALLGQVLARDERHASFAGGTALLQSASGELISAAIESDGEFSFDAPTSGRARLVLSAAELQLVVEELELPTE